MVFINPYFLFALIFASIPLVLHLITKKQIKILKFPSLIFIKESLQKESRKIRIKELLLLIIRTLIIIFIILSISKPVFYTDKKEQLAKVSDKEKSIVIILDNSYSMGIISGGEDLFKKSKRIALRILNKFIKDNDNISLILSADASRVKFYDLTYNKDEVIQYIKDAGVSLLNNNLFESLLDAKKILDKSRNPQRIIYLITDMQKLNFHRNENFIYPHIKIKYPIFLIKNSAEDKKNSAVVNNQIPLKLNFKNDAVSFYPMIKNFSFLKNNLIIKTIINNEAVNQKSLSLNPHEKKSINVQYIISSTGYLGGMTEIADGDDLIYDNQNYFVLYVPEKISINVLNKKNELFYVLNAINPAYVLNKKIKSYINIKEVKDFSSMRMRSGDILIFNYNHLNFSDVKKIKNVLHTGSILMFPSKDFNINNFNSVLAKTSMVEGLVLHKKENREKPFSIEFVDYTHPIFDIFKDIKIFKNTKVYSYFRLRLSDISLNTRIIAKFSNGDPAIIEYQTISGNKETKSKIIFFTFLADVRWTDFVYNPNFPPLIHQCIKYLLNKSEEDYLNKFQTGQSIDDVSSLLDNKSKIIKPVLGEKENYIKDNIIVQPGVYKAGNKFIAVNVDYHESDLTTLPVDELIEKYKGLSFVTFKGKKEIEEKLFLSHYAKSLWRLFLILALIFLIAELIIANELYMYIKPVIDKYKKR